MRLSQVMTSEAAYRLAMSQQGAVGPRPETEGEAEADVPVN